MVLFTLFSVDWDFFIWNPAEAEANIKTHPGTDKEKEVGSYLLCDWSHHEKHSEIVGSILWQTRFASFHRNGIDIEKEINIRPELGCTAVDEFLNEISQVPKYQLAYADSHGMIYPILQTLNSNEIIGKYDIISFDAHADLGYGNDSTKYIDCANWLYIALYSGKVNQATIVYPDWKGLKEAKERNRKYLKPYKKQIRMTTWSQYKKHKKNISKIVMPFICRSSAWTPPWMDQEFDRLVKSFPADAILCLDTVKRIDKIGGYKANEPREWNREEALEFAESYNKLLTPIK